MANLTENTTMAKATANIKFGQWIEQTLPFTDESGPVSDESRKGIDESLLPEPDAENPINRPLEGELLLPKP